MFVSIDQYYKSVLIFFRLFARQIGIDHYLFPLLPPNRYLYLDKKRVVNVTTVSDARWHYNTYLELHAFNKKKRKYVEGALYTNIFYSSCRIINLCKGQHLDIVVTTEHNVKSIISIYVEADEHHPHLCCCQKIGRLLSKHRPNTYRKNCKDKGEMYVVGTGKLGSSNVGTYKLTESKGLEDELQNLSSAEEYYRNIGFGETIDIIKKIRNIAIIHL